MATIQNFMDKYGDKRVEHFPLMSTPYYTIFLTVFYVYFVKILGPRLMKNRQPYRLENTMRFYNLFQVLLCFWFFKEGAITMGWLTGKMGFGCIPVDYSNDPLALWGLKVAWLYFMSKLLDWLDTVFMVLRKKNGQITNLHVFHHAFVPLGIWMGLKFVAGGHGVFLALINSFIHVVMYTYYFLSSFGPKIQKYLWWKKHLTLLQMVQFLVIILRDSYIFSIECDYPKIISISSIIMNSVFLVLFSNFYINTYSKTSLKPPVSDKRGKKQ